MPSLSGGKPAGGGRAARTPRILALAAAMIAALACQGCDAVARYYFESKALTTGPNGPETPGSNGIPFQRVQIPSGSRLLDSYVVRAPASCYRAPVVLIYHGVQETISMWVGAQEFLYRTCISSVVFDYSGSGNSSRPARFEWVNDDCVAAYDSVRTMFSGSRIFVMGHSMGNGPMLAAIPRFHSAPDGVIVANAFVSIRELGARSGPFFALLARFSPDWWNNESAIAKITSPLLVVHSDADTVNPAADGQTLYAAARQPKDLLILHGFAHNNLYRKPGAAWWAGVESFMRSHNS